MTTSTMTESKRGADGADPAPRKRRWGRWFVVAAVVLGGAAGLVAAFGGNGTDDPAAAEEPATFAEVVVTDLVSETSFDGTLGRTADDPLAAVGQGALTWVPEPGETLTEGDVAYAIDGEPVVLLVGEIPLYRTLQEPAEEAAIEARIPGVVTWVPEPGTVVQQGDVLFEISGEPVVLLYGDTPAYRTLANLRTDLEGDDVLQLEEALVALGYGDDLTVDGVFTGATENAVEDLQEAIGATDDGTLTLGEVVFADGAVEITGVEVEVGDTVGDGRPILLTAEGGFMEGDDVAQLETSLAALGFDAGGTLVVDGVFDRATTEAVEGFEAAYGLDVDGRIDRDEVVYSDGAVRVSGHAASVGSTVAPGAPVLTLTGADTLVIVELPAADQDTLEEGTRVTVELPDGTEVAGEVTFVDTVASTGPDGTFFEVQVVLDDPASANGLDEAPVDVRVVTDSATGVTAVPVSALLALAEGGYAVEVGGPGGTRLVAVEPGFFADGMVEVEGAIEPGDRVVVP